MNKIEIIGRLKENIYLNGKKFICKDINLDSDFIIDFAMELMQKLGYTSESKKIQYEKFFDDEKITKVEFDINYSGEDYSIIITRNTFSDKILIGCIVLSTKNDLELFGSVYELKVKVIEVYNKVSENSNIFFVEDYNNERICKSAYIEIYRVETRLRNLLTRYLMKKHGELVLSNTLKNEVDRYSKWFKKENKGKYKTFMRINTDYSNLDFSSLPKVLELKDSKILNQEGVSVFTEIEELIKLFEDEEIIDGIHKQMSDIQKLIDKRRYIFDDKLSGEEKGEEIKLYGSSSSMERTDLRDILDEDFRKLWVEELSNMRNMVAHNKPICKELYDDIISTCEIVDKRFDNCIEFIESNFYPDEEGVRSALEEMEYDKEKWENDYIENERELFGIEMSLSQDVIETQIIESQETIQGFMGIIYDLSDMRNIMEDIADFIEEFSIFDGDKYNEEFNYRVFSIIDLELELNIQFSLVKEMSAYEIVEYLLFDGIDIEKVIEFYTDDFRYPRNTFKFECFNMDYDVEWYGIDNKEYRVIFDGTLVPENGGEDDLEFKLYIDKIYVRTYYIRINYGDYEVPSQSYIDDEEVKYLIEDIGDIIRSTVDKFKDIQDVSIKLMDLI